MALIDRFKTTRARVRALAVCAGFVALFASAAALAQEKMATQATLLDRIQIEDLFSSYYSEMTSGGRKELASYYARDAALDLNGFIFKGHEAIKGVYAGGADMGGPPGSRFHMLLNNLVVRIDGNTATADMVFTGIVSDTVNDTPRLFEQGRDHTELEKQDGRWLIKKRVITSDGGLPKDFAKTLDKAQERR